MNQDRIEREYDEFLLGDQKEENYDPWRECLFLIVLFFFIGWQLLEILFYYSE